MCVIYVMCVGVYVCMWDAIVVCDANNESGIWDVCMYIYANECMCVYVMDFVYVVYVVCAVSGVCGVCEGHEFPCVLCVLCVMCVICVLRVICVL